MSSRVRGAGRVPEVASAELPARDAPQNRLPLPYPVHGGQWGIGMGMECKGRGDAGLGVLGKWPGPSLHP